jgi:cytochrome c oxidase subunit 1
MSMAATITQPVERENYLNKEYGVWSWLLTTDHKRIALLYLISITFFFFIGGFFALLIRLELLTPAGDLVNGHGVFLSYPFHSRGAWELSCADDDRG